MLLLDVVSHLLDPKPEHHSAANIQQQNNSIHGIQYKIKQKTNNTRKGSQRWLFRKRSNVASFFNPHAPEGEAPL